jgi:NAD(P)H-hydrate epimerase
MGCAVKADLTIAIAYKKLGHLLYPGAEYNGKVALVDIGVYGAEHKTACFSYVEADVKRLPIRPNYSNKGTFGKVLIIAGSNNMAGAAYLAAIAAYRTGCGLVRIFTPKENRQILQTLIPEAILTTYDSNDFHMGALEEVIKWADVIDIGPGLGISKTSEIILEKVLEQSEVPLVIDADAINLLANNFYFLKNKKPENIIITPHLGEMSRLCGCDIQSIASDLIHFATDFAHKHKLICVLKDSRTIVADWSEKVYINQSGNNGMATAGSGDVLSGIIASLIAQSIEPYESATLGVYLHGLAGDYAASQHGRMNMIARDIVSGLEKIECNLT